MQRWQIVCTRSLILESKGAMVRMRVKAKVAVHGSFHDFICKDSKLLSKVCVPCPRTFEGPAEAQGVCIMLLANKNSTDAPVN